ncbi:hypothetical protein THAOC_35234, partial [Thalassiosira oceanica]
MYSSSRLGAVRIEGSLLAGKARKSSAVALNVVISDRYDTNRCRIALGDGMEHPAVRQCGGPLYPRALSLPKSADRAGSQEQPAAMTRRTNNPSDFPASSHRAPLPSELSVLRGSAAQQQQSSKRRIKVTSKTRTRVESSSAVGGDLKQLTGASGVGPSQRWDPAASAVPGGMDVCYCWQWGHLGAAVGLCLASALAGSTLTLLVVSFLDKRDGATGPAAVDTSGSSVAATATSTPGDGDEDALDDARLLSKEASYAPKPRREEVGANNQVDDDGAIKDNPHYRPVGARAERRISKITGSFTGVDGEKRSLASLIGEVFGDDYDDDDDNDNSKSDREKCGSISSGGCGSTRRCSISSVNVEFDAADSSEHGGTGQQRANYAEMFIDDEKALRRSQKFEEHVVSKLTSLEESKLLLHRTRAISALASPLMAAADEEACYEGDRGEGPKRREKARAEGGGAGDVVLGPPDQGHDGGTLRADIEATVHAPDEGCRLPNGQEDV